MLIYTLNSTATTVTKINSVDLSSTFIDMMNSPTSLVITAIVVCTCTSKSLVTFACFSANQNCYAVTSNSEKDCTAPK